MENGIQEFLGHVMTVVGERKNPTVFGIVHSEMGLELLFNTNDMVMKLGMLDVAKMTVVEQQAAYVEEHEEETREAGRRASAVLASKPGRAN